MQQPIQDGRGQNMIIENFAPVQKALVTGNDQTGPLIAPDNQSKEKTGFKTGQGQVAEFIDDEQLGIGQLFEGLFQAIFTVRFAQAGHQGLQGQEEHRIACFHGFEAQGHR